MEWEPSADDVAGTVEEETFSAGMRNNAMDFHAHDVNDDRVCCDGDRTRTRTRTDTRTRTRPDGQHRSSAPFKPASLAHRLSSPQPVLAPAPAPDVSARPPRPCPRASHSAVIHDMRL